MLGYPVLVRPSYVLGGRAMEIVQNPTELARFVQQAAEVSGGKPILIDKYLEGKEVEVDAICDGERVLIPGIMEHIERAGVHSGDSMAVYPGVHLTPDEVDVDRRLHDAHRPRAERARPDERAVRDHAVQRWRARGIGRPAPTST